MELPGTLETPDVKPSEDGALAKPMRRVQRGKGLGFGWVLSDNDMHTYIMDC